MAVRQPAEERTAGELHRGVEGTEQADEDCAGSVRARVEWQQGDHDAVPDHVHEHRDEQEYERRPATPHVRRHAVSLFSINRRVCSITAAPTAPGSAWMGLPNSTLASTLRRTGTSTWSVAASHSRSRLRRRRWIRGLRKAESEITPLTTTGTTSSPGIRRAKRSALEDQRSRASTAPGKTAGSGSILPPGNVSTPPPLRRCLAAARTTPERPAEVPLMVRR